MKSLQIELKLSSHHEDLTKILFTRMRWSEAKHCLITTVIRMDCFPCFDDEVTPKFKAFYRK